MIIKNQKLLIFGLGSLLPIILGGCASPETVKPNVSNTVAKSGNTYVIQRASIHTPATDRQWQQRKAARAQQLAAKRAHLLSAAKRRAQTASVKSHPKPVTRSTKHNAQTAKAIQQQSVSRAQYQARYKAKLQAAAKRRAARATPAKKPRTNQKPQLSRAQLAKNKARAAQISRAQWAKNKARLAQLQVAKKQHTPRKAPVTSLRQQYIQRWEKEQARKKLERQIESKKADITVERVIHNAKKQIGTKYVWGGASPKKGFDCSGLVQHSMKKGAGIKVPRTAAEQYKAAVKVPKQQASRGDLVFFKTRGKSVSHVGIYLGGNKFVHAPRTGLRVTTTKLSGYWKRRFVGFGRIPGACKVPI